MEHTQNFVPIMEIILFHSRQLEPIL